jgi:hypothetical protein
MADTSDSLFELTDPVLSEKYDNDDLDSLPSISTDEIYSDDEDYDDDAQAEWERSLEQVQMLLTMVIVPFVGKYFGRKFAYWSKFRPILSLAAKQRCQGEKIQRKKSNFADLRR